MLSDMEHAIESGATAPLRAYAGVCSCLAHGVLRWKDLIRSEDLHLTNDALVGVAWRMKRKLRKQPWAALRRGLTNTDWALRWLKALALDNMPGEDFVIFGVSRDFRSFRPRVACFADAVAAMRMLLMSFGMDAALALTFTMH